MDGKVLVDSSNPGGPGDTDITKTVTSDASLTFTSPLELANMVGPLTQVDENGDVKTPGTSEIASVGVAPAWNQSQEWSSPPIFDNNGYSAHTDPIETLFNGVIGTGNNAVLPQSGGTFTLNFSTLSSATTVKLYYLSLIHI